MNLVKHIFIGIVSIVQSFLGLGIISFFTNTFNIEKAFDEQFGDIMLFAIGAVILAFISCTLRGYRLFGWFLMIPEIILLPFALPRFIISTIFFIISAFNDNIEFCYFSLFDSDLFEDDSIFQKFTRYLFGFIFDGCGDTTKVGNFFTQLFICVPLAIGQGACFWVAIDLINKDVFPVFPFILFGGVTLITGLFCTIRGQETRYYYYHGNYKFRHKHSGLSFSKYNPNEDEPWRIADNYEDDWEIECDGYDTHFTGWMFFSLLNAPILFVTQTVGLIFALISSPRIHICSIFAKPDFSMLRLSFFQRITYFYFNLIFV